jgi:hypothetical protein
VRAREFLLEYNRQVTANQVGNKLLLALANDESVGLPHFLSTLSRKLKGIGRMDPSKLDAVIPPEQQKDNINAILAAIEEKDPTPNKAYTAWLAKTYAKGNPIGYNRASIENMNRLGLLRLFDIAKRRRIIRPEHADINRFKTYNDFEMTMLNTYDLDNLDLEPKKEQSDGKATKVFQDNNVTIVVPEDEAAACKYGRNTRWCTASTRGYNMFDQYNRQGKLYILIPKNPKYEGEKYQLHFPSNSYMDENDDSIPLSEIFIRFPGIKEFFVQNEPELQNKILFISDDQLQQAIESVAELVQEKVWETLSDWETQDDGYYQFLRDEGLVDEENGDIDWDKVEQAGLTYSEYNPEVERWSRDIMNIVTPTPEQLRDIMEDDPYEFQNFDTMKNLPDVIGTILRNHYSGRRDEGDANIGQYLREKISMKKEGDKWKAYYVSSLRLPN